MHIAELLRKGKSLHCIAKSGHRENTTLISGEIERNSIINKSGETVFLSNNAYKKYVKRQKESKRETRVIENSPRVAHKLTEFITTSQLSSEEIIKATSDIRCCLEAPMKTSVCLSGSICQKEQRMVRLLAGDIKAIESKLSHRLEIGLVILLLARSFEGYKEGRLPPSVLNLTPPLFSFQFCFWISYNHRESTFGFIHIF